MLLESRSICMRIYSMNVLVLDFRVKSKQTAASSSKDGKANNIVDFNSFITAQKENLGRFREAIASVKADLVSCLTLQCTQYICNTTKKAPSSLPHEKYNSIKMNNADFYEKMIEVAQASGSVVQQSKEYIYATSKRKANSLDQYSSQLQQSLSTISQYIEDSNNMPVHAASVYDVAYTKELLDDSALLAAEGTPAYLRESKAAHGLSEHHVSYTTRAAIRLVCRRILSIFRIVDYMMRDLLYELLKQELSALQALVKQAHKLYAENHRALIAQHQQLQHPGVSSDGDIAVYQHSIHSGASKTSSKPAASPVSKKKGVDSSSSIVSIAQTLGSLYFALAISVSEFSYRTLTESQIESTSLHVIPTVDVCVEAFSHTLREICLACQYSEGLLFNEQCLSVLRPISNEFNANPLPDRIFQNDMDGGSAGAQGGGGGTCNTNEIQTMSKQCLYYFQQSFVTLNKYTHYLNGFKKQYIKNLSLLLKTERYKLLENNTEDILSDLEMFDAQAIVMGQLSDYYQVGIIFVNILPMKKILSSSVAYNLSTYNKYIPRLYLHYSDIFYKEIAGFMDKLNTKYSSIDEYIKNVEVYNIILGKQDAMSDQFSIINRLKEIMEIRNIKITDEISKQNLLLTTIYTKLNLLTNDFHEELENQVKIYRIELSNRLKSVLVPIQDLQAYFVTINAMLCNRDLNGELDDDESPNFIDSESILTMLFDYKQQIVSISKQLGVLDYYQSLLRVFVFEHNLQLEIQSELHAYILLFQHFQSILRLKYRTLMSHYMDICAMSLGKEISVYKQELVDCEFFSALMDQVGVAPSGSSSLDVDSKQPVATHVDVQNNQGILRLYTKVLHVISTLELYIPVLTVLQSKALTSDHQVKINKLLSTSLFDLASINTNPGATAAQPLSLSISVDHGSSSGQDYTLGALIETHNILDHRAALHDIYEEAVVLFNIDNKLLSIIRQINALEFDFHYESDNKSLLYISNYRVLIDDLYDHLLSVQSISQSTAYNLIANKYGVILVNYQDYILYLKYLHNIQLAYSKYKMLFISARSARHLSVYMRNYKYLDDTYRLLIKSAKTSKYIYLFLNDRQNRSYILSCVENINVIEQGFQSILQDFCEKYPKLYLVCPNVLYQTFLISSLKDLTLLCIPYLLNYMNITNVEFDISDDVSIVSIVCAEEKVMFIKPCSGRNSIHDFFKLLESSIHERFEKDVRELCMLYVDERKNIALLDEIKHNKYSSQALVLVYQIQFWNHFWSMLTSSTVANTSDTHSAVNSAKPLKAVYNRSTQSKMKQFIMELQEQISMLYTVYTDTVQAYTIKFTSNMVMLICYYRDILKNILEEYNVCWDSEINNGKQIYEVMQSLSSVYCSMQKFIVSHPYNTNAFNVHIASQTQNELLQNVNNVNFNAAQHVYVLMGGEKVKYGLKYQGFHERLTITPLVDKFYYHLYQPFSSHCVSTISTGNGSSFWQDTKLLKSFGYELGIEHFVFDVNDWLLSPNNPNLYNMLPLKQGSASNGFFSISDISQDEIDQMQRQDPLGRFAKIMRAALKLGLWVILKINHDATAGDNDEFHKLFSHVLSTLSVVYEEVHNKVFLAPMMSNAKIQKFELFRNMPASVTVDHTHVCNMKWTLLHRFPASSMADHQQYQLVSRSFRPVQLPQINFKVILALLLSSFNFVQVLRLSERLDALVVFLCANTTLQRNLAEFLLLKSIGNVGVNNDHILINVALQLKVLVKTYLNSLPSQVFAEVWHKELLPAIYNLHLEMLFDAEKEAKEFGHASSLIEQVKGGCLNYESAFRLLYDSQEEKVDERPNQAEKIVEHLVEALWDFNYPPQINRTLVNDNILDMDISAILPASGPAGSSAQSENGPQVDSQYSVNYQQLAHQLYKNSVLLVGNVGVGKTNVICKALIALRERHYVEEKQNVRIYPYIVNQQVLPGMLALQEKVQLFLNGDRHNALNIMCLDDYDCLHLHQLVRFIHIYHRQQRVKCIGEVLHLGEVDPSIIVSHRIITVNYLYTVDQLINRHARQCWEGESLIFRRVVMECTDDIVKPVINRFANQCYNPQILALDVIPQMYACISSLFHAYCFPHSAYSEVYNTTPASPRVGGIAALHAKLGSTPQVLASEMNSHPDTNKPYKTPNTSFDEDSLRKIVVYSLLQTLGHISTYRYKSVALHDIDRYHEAIEAFLQHSYVDNKEVSSVTKKAFPRQTSLLFSQYLTPRLQAAGSSVLNQPPKSGTKSIANNLMVLEWTIIDQKHIMALQQLQHASSVDSFNRHALVTTNTPLTFPIHTYHTLVAPTPLTVHLTYLQSGYTHILPVFNQYMNSRNTANSILFHDASFAHNMFSSRGFLLTGDPGSGRSTLLRQMLCHQALSKFNKHWIVYYQSGHNVDSSAAGVKSNTSSSLSDFILGGQLRLQKQRYEHNISNVGALFIDDLHLDHDVRKCKEVLRGIAQYNTIYDSKILQFKLVQGFYMVAASAGAYSWNQCAQEKIAALNIPRTDSITGSSADASGVKGDGHVNKTHQLDLYLDARYERVTRHFHKISLAPSLIVAAFVAYVDSKLGFSAPDFCHDLVSVVYHSRRYLQHIGAFAQLQSGSLQGELQEPNGLAMESSSLRSQLISELSFSSDKVSSLKMIYSSLIEKYPSFNASTVFLNSNTDVRSSSASTKNVLDGLLLGVKALSIAYGNKVESANHMSLLPAPVIASPLASMIDVVHVFDRVCNEDLIRYMHSAFVFDVYNTIVDHVTNHVVSFKTSNLAASLEKLRLSRAACHENISCNNSGGLSLFEPISYTRSAYGFYKTSNTSMPNLLTAEALRDAITKHFQIKGVDDTKVLLEVDHISYVHLLASFMKQPTLVTADNIQPMSVIQRMAWECAKLERHNLSFWHDVLQILTFWTHAEQTASISPLVLYLQDPVHSYNTHYLAESSNMSSCLPVLYDEPCVSRIMRILVSMQFYDCVQYWLCDTSSGSQLTDQFGGICGEGDNNSEAPLIQLLQQFGLDRLRNALAAVLLFLLDAQTFLGLQGFISHHAITFADTLHRDTGSFAVVPNFLTVQLQQMADRVVSMYAQEPIVSVDSSRVHTIWLLQSRSSAKAEATIHIMEDISLQGSLVSRLFQLLHPKFDLLQYVHGVSPCLQDYLTRQKLVVLHDGSPLPKNLLAKTKALFEGNVRSYAVHSDYLSNEQTLEKILLSYLQHTTRLALIDTVCDEKLFTRKALDIISSMVDTLCAQVSAATTRTPFPQEYIRGELLAVCLNTLKTFVIWGCRLDEFARYKQRVKKLLEGHLTIDNSKQRFLTQYLSSLQPVDFLLINVLRTFYYQSIPDSYVIIDGCSPTSALTTFISRQFSLCAPIGSSVQPQHLPEISILYDTMMFAACSMQRDAGVVQSVCAKLHCLPNTRLSKGFLFSLLASYYTAGVVLIQDDLFSLLLLNSMLELSIAPSDIINVNGGFKVDIAASNKCSWRSDDSHTYRMTLSHHEYLCDFFLAYLLEQGLVSNTCALLQDMYRHAKDSILSSQDEGKSIEEWGEKRLTKYNSQYEEAIHTLAPIVDTLMLLFRQACKVLERRGHAGQVEIIYAIFDGLKNSIKSFDMLAAQSGEDSGIKLSLKELIGASVFAFMSYTLPIFFSDEEFAFIVLDTFLDFYLLPYSLISHTQQLAEHAAIPNSSLLDYRSQLFSLLATYLSPSSTAGGYKLDSKYGIVVSSNALSSSMGDETQGSKKKRKKTLQYINSGLSSQHAEDESASLGSAGRSRDDADNRSNSDLDGSSVDSDDSKEEEDEFYMLAPEAKYVFRQCLVLLSQVIHLGEHTFSAKYIVDSRMANFHDNLHILDGIHDEIDIFVDFSASIYTTIKSFPEAQGYKLNALEKLFLSLFCKVDSAVTLCKDLIASCGLFLDLEDRRVRDTLFEWQLRRCSTADSNVRNVATTNNLHVCLGYSDGLSQIASSSHSSPITAALDTARQAVAYQASVAGGESTDYPEVDIAKRGTNQSFRFSIAGTRMSSMRVLDSDSLKKKTLTLYFASFETGMQEFLSFLEHYSKQYAFSTYEGIFVTILNNLPMDTILLQKHCQQLSASSQVYLCYRSVVIDPAQSHQPRDVACHTLSLCHIHSRHAILGKLNFYIRYTSSLPYLIDTSLQNLFGLELVAGNSHLSTVLASAGFVDLFVMKVKMMADRCRWLVIFFHIAVCYYEESVRYSDAAYRRSLSTATLAHAAFSVEKAIINGLRQSIQSYVQSQNANSSISISAEEVADDIVKLSYAQFDEVYLHHILLLLIYYPSLRSAGLDAVSTVDDLYVKYIFENIFTHNSCRYNCTYAILDSLPLPMRLDLEDEETKSFFDKLVSMVSDSSEDSDKLFQLFFVSKPEYNHKVWSVLKRGMPTHNLYGASNLAQKQAGNATGQPQTISAFALYRHHGLASIDMLLRHMACLLSGLLFSLPDFIDLHTDSDQDECFHNVLSHFKVEKDMESVQGRKTMVARPQEMSKNMYKGGSKLRRKLGHSKLLNFNARDYDPLLMHMLSEVDAYNTQLTVARKVLFMMIAACNSGEHFEILLVKGLCSDVYSVAAKLFSHLLPSAVCSAASMTATGGMVSFTGYAQFWKSRYDLLSRFTRTGHLDNVQLFLLSNVSGLLYAMKESYSAKTDSSVDKIHLHYDMMSCAQYQHYLKSNYHQRDSQENMGCNIRATNVALLNCRLIGRGINSTVYNSGTNSASLSLDLLPVTAQTSFGTVRHAVLL
ncbi:hypothetical protein EON65_02255 [archaeon]|nr:MAG: hypothetical protein EON65_02255 [archaeon]